MALKFLKSLKQVEKNHQFLATHNKKIVALSEKDFKVAVNHSSPTVYFIRCGKYIKIGHTRSSLSSRIASLQTGNPEELEVMFAWKTPNAVEAEGIFHKHFAHRHKRGEWYELNENDFYVVEEAIKRYWNI